MPLFSIIPSLPAYSGPYSVGSSDVELPVSELSAPSSAPEGSDIGTVAFRVFYPCEAASNARPIRWLPGPQKAHLAAYVKFVGANSMIASGLSFFPNLLYYSSIPALRNAPLLEPKTREGRWPVMVFSHGLGGSRNAYSQICGSLASHGVIVIASDHRDQSAPISYIRATSNSPAKILEYNRQPHTPSQEVYGARDEQLKIRMWELGLIHDAVLRMDNGEAPQNLDPNSSTWRKKDTNEVLGMFRGRMAVQKPGSIIWAGHSFGACTVTQLLKATYWGLARGDKAVDNPLFCPAADSALSKQITPRSPLILLDMWGLPFQSPATRDLWKQPLPCYAQSGKGGGAVLSVLSDAFVKWSGNLTVVKSALTSNVSNDSRSGPHMFYPTTSAHLSQSDFGILFSWVIKKALKTEEPPERYIKLNTRAILQVLRESGVEVADTSAIDREEIDDAVATKANALDDSISDRRILDVNGNIPGWIAISTNRTQGTTVPTKSLTRSASSSISAAPHETEVLGEVAA